MGCPLPKKYMLLICSAGEELEAEYIDGKFVALEVTTASEGLNLFNAAHFMLHYYCCQKGKAHTEIEQTRLKPRRTRKAAKPVQKE